MIRRTNSRLTIIPAVAIAFLLGAATVFAQTEEPVTQEPSPDQTAPEPESPEEAAQAAEEQKREARIKKDLADQESREAESRLQDIREEQEKAERSVKKGVFPTAAREKLEHLESEADYEDRRQRLSDLRNRYADELEHEAEKRQALAIRREQSEATLASLDELTSEQRRKQAEGLQGRADEERETAGTIRAVAEAEKAAVDKYRALQTELAEQLDIVQAEPESARRDEAVAQLRRAIDQVDGLIAYQRLVAYSIRDQAAAHEAVARAYVREADALLEASRRFWVRHAYLLNIARVVLLTIAATIAINILAWMVARAASAVARRLPRRSTTPGVKRVHTMVYFTRSIIKLLVWTFAIVTILAEFGISPGQSAGALGVIGLVLAGMFQQLVVDFVKGIDIATGGHYFIGDFIEVAGKSGHVLDFRVKYTVLRTPSGQVLNIPNSQCIPSRRFPLGYVDNYVDIPLASGADVERAWRALAVVGKLLNERVEAVKREPERISTFHDGETTIVRTRVRVLPTCDWVITDRYIPMVKSRFGAEGIPVAGEPTFFFINNVAVFRRLFSRQMTEEDIARTAEEEARPTVERPDHPDPDAPTPPDEAETPRGPVESS